MLMRAAQLGLAAVLGFTSLAEAQMPGSGVPVFNWPRPATQGPSYDGGASQAGYDYDPASEPDAVKYRQLPQRPEDMRPLVRERFDAQIASVQEPDVRLDLIRGRSKLITTKQPVVRVSIAEPGVVETVNFSPNEFELIGRTVGETTVTLWFGDAQPAPGKTPLHPNIRYLVKVHPDMTEEDVLRTQYGELAKRINELFPNSYVQLIAVADKLVVRGQARDAQEAAAIMSIVRGEAVDQSGALMGPGSWGWGGGFGGGRWGGRGARLPGFGANDWQADNVISMLEVPGEHQVLLKVRIARLTRGALRTIGSQFSAQAGDFSVTTNLNVAGAYQAVLNSTDVQLTLSALSSNRTTKMLAEPNLVTISGYPATFISGGSFAVPMVVGVNGIAGTNTQFQGFGTQLMFTPTVLDKDHIRLQVAPTVSEISRDAQVNGVPGLNIESAYTQVNLREGQWLAIAGLIQDKQDSSKVRVPWLGDIPGVDLFFSRRSVQRDETELVILVSPELVHPLEPEQVPMVLPGMEVTEPDDIDFFLLGRYEGRPDLHHRSTVWPVYQWSAFEARRQALWGWKGTAAYGASTGYYMQGPVGFSN
ncbi:MAG: pilus assembly protein N-terminal domain-containing protein [Pirellulales bacterium]